MVIFYLGFGLVELFAFKFEASRFWNWSIYAGYITVQSALLASFAATQVAHNDMRKFKFPISSMLILMTMVAIPLGTTAMMTGTVEITESSLALKQELLSTYSTMVTIVLYSTFIPLIFFAEAVLHWLLAQKQRLQQHGQANMD